MSQTRRLAAILAADVAGYSRLMGTDEEGTHERLKAHLREGVAENTESEISERGCAIPRHGAEYGASSCFPLDPRPADVPQRR
jgi:hypothetical protein